MGDNPRTCWDWTTSCSRTVGYCVWRGRSITRAILRKSPLKLISPYRILCRNLPDAAVLAYPVRSAIATNNVLSIIFMLLIACRFEAIDKTRVVFLKLWRNCISGVAWFKTRKLVRDREETQETGAKLKYIAKEKISD